MEPDNQKRRQSHPIFDDVEEDPLISKLTPNYRPNVWERPINIERPLGAAVRRIGLAVGDGRHAKWLLSMGVAFVGLCIMMVLGTAIARWADRPRDTTLDYR